MGYTTNRGGPPGSAAGNPRRERRNQPRPRLKLHPSPSRDFYNVSMGTLTLVLLAGAAMTSNGETMTQGERDRALSELHATRKLFLDAIGGLTEAQWRWKPAPDRWSVAEVAEHIALTEDIYWSGMERRLTEPPQPAKRAEITVKDDEVIPRMADRSERRAAGEANTPRGRFADAAAVSEHFRASRDRLIAFVRSTDADLRSRVWPHRAFGPLDGYQWILLTCGHIERHLQQINEVKAAARFPR